jgi:NAD(P)-dependent dehydrogenase (short-subunit alcohol dehydrogenase family)
MKIAVVTGANRGIGREIAAQLIGLDWTVVLAGRSEIQLEKASDQLGPNADFIVVDVNSQESVNRFASILQKKYKCVDALFNNAGIIGNTPLDEFNISEMEEVMSTNFMGPVRITAAVLPLLKKSKDARIINISSGMGSMDDLTSGYGAYRLSKWALNGFTILLANELAESGIKVNAVCPGWVRTQMGGSSAPLPLAKGAETPVWLATEKDTPTGKFFRNKKEISW